MHPEQLTDLRKILGDERAVAKIREFSASVLRAHEAGSLTVQVDAETASTLFVAATVAFERVYEDKRSFARLNAFAPSNDMRTALQILTVNPTPENFKAFVKKYGNPFLHATTKAAS